MILNATLCDYVRLTSFEHEDYVTMLTIWNTMLGNDETRRANIMQYGGDSYTHGFLGTGLQNRRPHYSMHYSGTAAAIAYHSLQTAQWADVRCTRIDAQITIPLPDGYN